jgi:hypothetical protein
VGVDSCALPDVYPTSVEGRITAMIVMLFGTGFLSVLTATVARFVKTERRDETDESLASLKRLETEVAKLRQQVSPRSCSRRAEGGAVF